MDEGLLRKDWLTQHWRAPKPPIDTFAHLKSEYGIRVIRCPAGFVSQKRAHCAHISGIWMIPRVTPSVTAWVRSRAPSLPKIRFT